MISSYQSFFKILPVRSEILVSLVTLVPANMAFLGDPRYSHPSVLSIDLNEAPSDALTSLSRYLITCSLPIPSDRWSKNSPKVRRGSFGLP